MNTFAGKAGATNLSRRPRAFAVAALAFLGCAICSCTTYPHSSLVEKWWKKYPPVYDPDDPDWEKKPPKLQEIAPPHFSTPTVIALQSSPSTRGPSRRLFAERYDPAEASEEGLRRLHDCQELLLRHSDSLLAKASRHLASLVVESETAASDLQKPAAERWQREREEAYREIVQRVLTYAQRGEHDRLQLQGKDRDEIWRWLFPTEQQKRAIKETYTGALQRSQPAWPVSKALATPTLGDIEQLCDEMRGFVRGADHVCSEHRRLSQDAADTEEKLRQFERELVWLKAHLDAETDPVKKLTMRKQIVDKQVAAKQLEVDAQRLRRLLGSHKWRVEELAKAKVAVSGRLAALEECYQARLGVLEKLSSLSGRMSNQCSEAYEALRQALTSEMAVLRKYG